MCHAPRIPPLSRSHQCVRFSMFTCRSDTWHGICSRAQPFFANSCNIRKTDTFCQKDCDCNPQIDICLCDCRIRVVFSKLGCMGPPPYTRGPVVSRSSAQEVTRSRAKTSPHRSQPHGHAAWSSRMFAKHDTQVIPRGFMRGKFFFFFFWLSGVLGKP